MINYNYIYYDICIQYLLRSTLRIRCIRGWHLEVPHISPTVSVRSLHAVGGLSLSLDGVVHWGLVENRLHWEKRGKTSNSPMKTSIFPMFSQNSAFQWKIWVLYLIFRHSHFAFTDCQLACQQGLPGRVAAVLWLQSQRKSRLKKHLAYCPHTGM